MAIREFSPDGIPRAKLAFVGDAPQGEDLKRFTERDFECEVVASKKLRGSKYAAKLDAVVWTQDPQKLTTLPRELGETVPSLLDNDVRVYVRLATDATFSDTPRRLVVNALIEAAIPAAKLLPPEWRSIPESRRERENNFLLPCVYIVDSAVSWAAIATMVCDRPAGPSPKAGLKVDEKLLRKHFGAHGHNERMLLLRRAFWKCSDLTLTVIDGGLSGATAFKAYASLDAGLVQGGIGGAYPHLYFVKLGPRKKIVDEFDKYCGQVLEYVPFHLGPRLRLDRCNLGSTQGVLVGDFVEGTESLVACLRADRGGHAISNLFDRTLGGWRKQARVDSRRSLSRYLEKKWLVDGSDESITLPPMRSDIVRQLGGETDVSVLRKVFDNRGNSSTLVAPAHGDMHAKNILVRQGDAILIDFEKIEKDYPLTYDPASLEGGLLVEGFIKELEEETLTVSGLVTSIGPLYERSALRANVATLCRRGDGVEWYYNAVNQIRTFSWAAEKKALQYALTLGLCLIRKGCNTHEALDVGAANDARAVAFFFGQKILREMSGG